MEVPTCGAGSSSDVALFTENRMAEKTPKPRPTETPPRKPAKPAEPPTHEDPRDVPRPVPIDDPHPPQPNENLEEAS